MTTIGILAALIIGAIIGLVVSSLLAAGKADDAYRRGRLDERASALARALWEADNDRFGGTE